MNITKLTVVNECLASMGEEPINSLAEVNAYVNSALFALENANLNEQSEGWWFNKEVIELVPDKDGFYILPSDIIDLNVDEVPPWMSYRDGRLYNNTEGQFLKGTRRLAVNVIRLVAFERLPIIARRLIKASAVAAFQKSYDGDAAKIADADEEYGMARVLAKAQHIRAVRANLSAGWAGAARLHAGPRYGRRLRTPR